MALTYPEMHGFEGRPGSEAAAAAAAAAATAAACPQSDGALTVLQSPLPAPLSRPCEYQVRAAISLNNMAVTLLADRRCYRRAHLLLMDAASIFRLGDSSPAVTPVHAASQGQDTSSARAFVDARVQRAETLFRQRPDAPARKADKRRTNSPDVQVLSDDLGGTAETVSHTLTVLGLRGKGRSSCAVLLIRIEGLDFDDPNLRDRVAATVLYNYAMTFIGQISLLPEQRRATSLARGSCVLNAAMSLVASSALAPELQSDPERWWLLRFLVESSALRVGSQLQRQRNRHGRHKETVPNHAEDDEAPHSQHRLLLSLRRTARQLSAYRHVLSLIAREKQVAGAA